MLTGTSDRLTPPVHAHALTAGLPRCLGVTELPGAGHMTPVERPDEINTRIRAMAAEYLPAT